MNENEVEKDQMYQIVLDVKVGEYHHYDYRYYLGAENGARNYANSELENYWGEGETYFEDDEYYANNDFTMGVKFNHIMPFPNLPVMTAKGAFHFESTGWRIV